MIWWEGKAEGGGKYTNIHVWVYQEGGGEGSISNGHKGGTCMWKKREVEEVVVLPWQLTGDEP